MGKLFASLFGGGKTEVVIPPPVEPPPVMPTPDDEAMRRAKMKSYAIQRERQGRASTIFTDDNTDALG